MPMWSPCKRRDFIEKLRRLGFARALLRQASPVHDDCRATADDPHNDEYSTPQVRMLLRQVEARIGRPIPVEEWTTL